MEYVDVNEITTPYYDMTYLDDTKTTHIAKIKEQWEVNYMRERFEVVDCKYVTAN